jgi:ABC-type antimicrobial peptide transport system permease subunit
MSLWTLIRRGLWFYGRSHFGVVLGAAIASAALIGALIVGDSVRGSLRKQGLERLQRAEYAMATADRFFRADLIQRLGGNNLEDRHQLGTNSGSFQGAGFERTTALQLAGTVSRQDGEARANHVNVIGIDLLSWLKLSQAGFREQNLASGGLTAQIRESWQAGELVLLNKALAERLTVRQGDEVILRVRKPAQLAQDAVVTPRENTALALRLKVGPIMTRELLGNFSLAANQASAANAFLPLEILSKKLDIPGRANLILNGPILHQHSPEEGLQFLSNRIENNWLVEDAQLSVKSVEQPHAVTGGEPIPPLVELTSSRIFLEPEVVAAALKSRTRVLAAHTDFGNDTTNDVAASAFVTNATCILTYLANLIRKEDQATPYSMITAVGGHFLPGDMRDDEILINEWLAEDLHTKPGDTLQISYYAVDSASHLTERTNVFHVRGVVPLKGIYADRTLMPDFPGVAKAESTQDWDTGFPLVYKIREKDEAYWKHYRGTPKAFVTLAAGQAMWSSRFGSLTSIRYEVPAQFSAKNSRTLVYKNLLANLNPTKLGFHFEPVREQALRAADQAQDFGQLFIGFSIFLVTAALLLMAILFQFSLEQRRTEVGTLLALGLRPRQVRRLLLGEGLVLALLGGLFGAAVGLGYAKLMLWGLATIWHSAIGNSLLSFYASPTTLFTGFCAGTVVAALTIWLALRKQARQPVRLLLSDEAMPGKVAAGRLARWVAWLTGLGGVAIVGYAIARGETTDPEIFFEAGSLLLIAGLAGAAGWLSSIARSTPSNDPTLVSLAVRACALRRKRSLATIALLACGCFVIFSIGVFRLDANVDATKPTSGTGGFALIGEATLPIVQDLNSESGREFFGLTAKDLARVSFVGFRVHEGDEASCLNLNRAQKPRLLGVEPGLLAGRFSFAGVAKGLDSHEAWGLLQTQARNDEIPAIGDANSIQWALGKSVGDTIDYTDELGRTFKLRLVGAVANSILQGNLIVDESEFVKKFPSESGYRYFLIDTPAAQRVSVSAILSRGLQDTGLELTPAVRRLDTFNAVQNTYLGTFQILGGLGLLLGSAGLGVVVLRNVLERRGELAVLLAVGFKKRSLQRLVLAEHGVLLCLGLGMGVAAAVVAVFPALLSPARQLPYGSLSATLGVVLLNGFFWTWLATRVSLRGNLLAALRNE